jgi:hypothetical protein
MLIQYFIPERRKRFLSCIKYYGQHIKNIKVEFAFEVGHGGLNIFQAISDCCVNLKGFWLAMMKLKQGCHPKMGQL